MPTVRTILPQNLSQTPILRVAAYCRVSTDSSDQQHSIEAQTEYYKKLIGENPFWTLADLYADNGITGTSMKHRDEFNRMIADCKRGKIDRILTKSVSRFARNTVDCLETVRLLSSLGISILFEKEQIDTAKLSSETLLGMMSTQAQDESNSTSGNMRWSYEKRMKSGDFSGCRPPYGYNLIQGTLVIDEVEAAVVRMIFRMYLDGSSIRTIVAYLNDHDIPRNGREEKWSRTTIRYILSNERYVGDALLLKCAKVTCNNRACRSLETVRMENEIARQFDSADLDTNAIRKQLFDLAAEKYRLLTAGLEITDKLRTDLASANLSSCNIRRTVMETVRQIILIDDDTIEITLINGQVLGKEQVHGTYVAKENRPGDPAQHPTGAKESIA